MAVDHGKGETRLMDAEKRFMIAEPAKATGRTVTGYASLFNVRSQNFGTEAAPIFEIIKPGAFDRVLNDDVRALVNHDSNMVLARSRNGKGTLKLSVDTVGLRYQFEAPDTQVGNDLLVSLKRQDLDQSSFSFMVDAAGQSWAKEGAARIRTITRVSKLVDISVVTMPAYAETSASARNAPKPPEALPITDSRNPEYWRLRIPGTR